MPLATLVPLVPYPIPRFPLTQTLKHSKTQTLPLSFYIFYTAEIAFQNSVIDNPHGI